MASFCSFRPIPGGVALTHNGALGSTPRRLLFSEGLLDADASTTPTNDNPPLLDFTLDEGELAAYSANWDAVFFAGGPTMGQQLRRFDLASGKWSFVLEDQLALGQTVLGLALDVPSAQVYLLHVPDALGAEAALVKVDLRTQSVDTLATFAYGGDAKQLSLRTTESGALILTRADANGFDVWRLDVSGASMSVAGHSRISAAELLDLPLVVGETLHAPVRPASGEDTILDIALDALQDSATVSTL